MKENIKKLVLVLGVGLVLGGSALAQSSNTIHTIANAGAAKQHLIGERGTRSQLCSVLAEAEQKITPGWTFVSLGDGTMFNERSINAAWKEKYPNATKEGTLQCDVERTFEDGTRKHNTVLPSVSVVW